jgi:hypothetical protein
MTAPKQPTRRAQNRIASSGQGVRKAKATKGDEDFKPEEELDEVPEGDEVPDDVEVFDDEPPGEGEGEEEVPTEELKQVASSPPGARVVAWFKRHLSELRSWFEEVKAELDPTLPVVADLEQLIAQNIESTEAELANILNKHYPEEGMEAGDLLDQHVGLLTDGDIPPSDVMTGEDLDVSGKGKLPPDSLGKANVDQNYPGPGKRGRRAGGQDTDEVRREINDRYRQQPKNYPGRYPAGRSPYGPPRGAPVSSGRRKVFERYQNQYTGQWNTREVPPAVVRRALTNGARLRFSQSGMAFLVRPQYQKGVGPQPRYPVRAGGRYDQPPPFFRRRKEEPGAYQQRVRNAQDQGTGGPQATPAVPGYARANPGPNQNPNMEGEQKRFSRMKAYAGAIKEAADYMGAMADDAETKEQHRTHLKRHSLRLGVVTKGLTDMGHFQYNGGKGSELRNQGAVEADGGGGSPLGGTLESMGSQQGKKPTPAGGGQGVITGSGGWAKGQPAQKPATRPGLPRKTTPQRIVKAPDINQVNQLVNEYNGEHGLALSVVKLSGGRLGVQGTGMDPQDVEMFLAGRGLDNVAIEGKYVTIKGHTERIVSAAVRDRYEKFKKRVKQLTGRDVGSLEEFLKGEGQGEQQ